MNEITYKFTKEEQAWFEERIEESHTGRIIIKTQLINKFRKISLDYQSDNNEIRDYLMRNLTSWY